MRAALSQSVRLFVRTGAQERPLRRFAHRQRHRLRHARRSGADPLERRSHRGRRWFFPVPARSRQRRVLVSRPAAERRDGGTPVRPLRSPPDRTAGAGSRIDACLEACVPADADGELRRVTLRNLDDRPRRIELTSYAEVVLNDGQPTPPIRPFPSCSSRPSGWRNSGRCWPGAGRARRANWNGLAGACPDRRSGSHRMTPIETDRARFIGRGYTLAARREPWWNPILVRYDRQGA